MTIINNISGTIPNTNKNIGIDVGFKNLILTGGNGCGKTSLLRELNRKLRFLYVSKQFSQRNEVVNQLDFWSRRMGEFPRGTHEYSQSQSQVERYGDQLREFDDSLNIEVNNENELSYKIDSRTAIIQFYEAVRKSSIQESTGTNQNIYNKNQNPIQTENDGSNLEQHLVNLKTKRSFAITEDKNSMLAESIGNWFLNFENNLRYLLEDDSFALIFESATFKFYLEQAGKPRYNFQNLSSGYAAIMDILADLIIKSELGGISPEELTGIVLIDEIDAHLHLSLQRKILPFLTGLFPRIQFIVTTHSPFVLSSEENVVIYDLTNLKQYKELTMISYEHIVEGLLGIPPVSTLLQSKIINLSELIRDFDKNEAVIKDAINELLPYKNTLDEESLNFLLQAHTQILLRRDNN